MKTYPVVAELASLRREKKMQAKEIAYRIGCATNTLQKMECGMKQPSMFMLVCWAEALGSDITLTPRVVCR